MIITITGKPCSGKGTVANIFCTKHKFEYICVGDIMREIAKQEGYEDLASFNANIKNVMKYDKIVDAHTEEIGKARINDNILLDSRLAWHFIPKSFKVFIDVSLDVAAKRLIEANRESEQVDNINSAKKHLTDRWNNENSRYYKLYKTNNLDLSNYDLVLNSDNLSPEELSKIIYREYKKFMRKA